MRSPTSRAGGFRGTSCACCRTAAMRRALELAWRGWGRVAPNPLVGAVVLRGDAVVGEGWHAEFGGPHAEVAALASAGRRARGGTLVVTLEPCAHHGKTPPCTDAILAAGGGRRVAAPRRPPPQGQPPRLTVRGTVTPRKPPVRVVFDRRAMLNPGVTLVATARDVPTWVMSSLEAPAASVTALEQNGVRVFRPASLAAGLSLLREAGIQSVLCEGGGALGARLLADGLVDRLYWVQAPVWLGGGAGPAFPGMPGAPLERAPRWMAAARRPLGART